MCTSCRICRQVELIQEWTERSSWLRCGQERARLVLVGDSSQLLLQDELLVLCLKLLYLAVEHSIFFDLLVEHYRDFVNLSHDKNLEST